MAKVEFELDPAFLHLAQILASRLADGQAQDPVNSASG